MSYVVERIIAPTHPSLPGHFPGQPIVPGVVVLDEVIAALAEWQPKANFLGVSTAKFISPLRPGVAFTIRLEATQSGRVMFECVTPQGLVSHGQLRIGSADRA
jgi:3-hydroxymyristoyl/3-hydroxydecanoyl-(acyl carrier protein) dehydratase